MNYRDAPPEEPLPGVDGGSRRRAIELAIVFLVVGSIVAAVVFVFTRKPPPSVDYGDLTPLVRTLEGNVTNTPCDKTSTIKLVQLYNQYRNFAGTIETTERYESKCSFDAWIVDSRVDAHRGLHEYSNAIKHAGRVVDATHSAASLIKRAQIHREFGHAPEALADYRRALHLDPADREALDGLVEMLDGENRPCDAVAAINAFLKTTGDATNLHQRAEAFAAKCK